MSLGILASKRGMLGAIDLKYPWKLQSQDTLDLQLTVNQALQAAGYCPVPPSGVLEGSTCGAIANLNANAISYFGESMQFPMPSSCADHQSEYVQPTPGCFIPSGKDGLLKLQGKKTTADGKVVPADNTMRNLVIAGGAISLLVIAVVAAKASS